MVPFQPPNPQKKPQSGMSGMLGAWVQAEKMIQVALMLPCAAFIGWAAGVGLDHLLHQTWIAMAGVVLGIVSGLVGAVRMAMVYGPGSDSGSEKQDGTKKGNSDPQS
ncbi:MAG: AtpZ/AtpI family protein [Terracidiphilus sp.]